MKIYIISKFFVVPHPPHLNDPRFVFSGPPKRAVKGGHLHMLKLFRSFWAHVPMFSKGRPKFSSAFRAEGSFRGGVFIISKFKANDIFYPIMASCVFLDIFSLGVNLFQVFFCFRKWPHNFRIIFVFPPPPQNFRINSAYHPPPLFLAIGGCPCRGEFFV